MYKWEDVENFVEDEFDDQESEDWTPDATIRFEGNNEGMTVSFTELKAILKKFTDVPFIVTSNCN